jgi:hypothetical protein
MLSMFNRFNIRKSYKYIPGSYNRAKSTSKFLQFCYDENGLPTLIERDTFPEMMFLQSKLINIFTDINENRISESRKYQMLEDVDRRISDVKIMIHNMRVDRDIYNYTPENHIIFEDQMREYESQCDILVNLRLRLDKFKPKEE